MRLRTCNIRLVQIAALVIATGTVIPTSAADYGTGSNDTRGTVLAMPARQSHDRPVPAHSPVTTPPRGMTKQQVIAAYGAPIRRHAAVGQPPITRWDYPRYRLYFEYNHVLHAVQPQALEPVVHTSGLSTTRP